MSGFESSTARPMNPLVYFPCSEHGVDLQPGDVVKVLESAALGWVRARVIRVKSGGRVVVQSDQGREFTARGNQVDSLSQPVSALRALPFLHKPLMALSSGVLLCPDLNKPVQHRISMELLTEGRARVNTVLVAQATQIRCHGASPLCLYPIWDRSSTG